MLNIRTIIVIACLLSSGGLAQTKKTAPVSSLAGCYSDIHTAGEAKELVVGSGTIILDKKGDAYTGTFQQLKDDGGEGFSSVALEHLVVNEARGTIVFTVQVYAYDDKGNQVKRASKATGRFTERGLKMAWQEDALQYGQPNPLMRKTKNCR